MTKRIFRGAYVMTTTRLYVLDGDHLVALEDCSPKCDLLVSEGMILLVKGKGICVFTEDGRPLGIALTKAPIRREGFDNGGVVAETRTHRWRFRRIRAASEERNNVQRGVRPCSATSALTTRQMDDL